VPELCMASSDAHAVTVSLLSRGLRHCTEIPGQSRSARLFAVSASHHRRTSCAIHVSPLSLEAGTMTPLSLFANS